jgi:GTP cyclohydrolase I
VANELNSLLKPKGVAVMLEGQHLCNMSRGVEQFNSDMKTVIFLGDFKNNDGLKDRFMRMAGH